MTTVRWYCEGRAVRGPKFCRRRPHQLVAERAVDSSRVFGRKRGRCWMCGSEISTWVLRGATIESLGVKR